MTLYLGTDPSSVKHVEGLIHYPVIRTIPLSVPSHIWDDFSEYTHILFTSKNGVSIFLAQCSKPLTDKQLIAIGAATAARLREHQIEPHFVAEEESQEGVIELLRLQDLTDAYILYPRSSLARKKLENFFIERQIRYQVCDLYETHFQKIEPVPNLSEIKEIIFTSPTTVRGFLEIYGKLPRDKKLTCIGPVTEEELRKY
ncbi:MAG TPA: uroporphyrinogen-III synthase [Rhabdochlamydiaceae bacterium]|jgi:uroporphyrinogen-III synthase|nr:uroporphyrinogen-III synthase [Rhabdochlamydiaceae bacterium]